MRITVVFHSADWDGQFCGQIARKFLPDAELIGWDFGDPPLPLPQEGTQFYVLDLPLDRPFGLKFGGHPTIEPLAIALPLRTIVWIDHHKSSIETHPASVPGYRIDGVAACRLAWQWFFKECHDYPLNAGRDGQNQLPSKPDYVERRVSEPLSVRLAGEYDIWDKRDPDAELFQHGLRSEDLEVGGAWNQILELDDTAGRRVRELLNAGRSIQYARTKENASIIQEMGFTFQWEGLTFLACNAARYNSLLFTSGLKPEHDACFGFKWTGKAWSVSLYHSPGKEHHDLSVIAVKHGGGGHRGACGFQTDKLPFLP